MPKFLLAATDIDTGATLYAKVSPSGRVISFRHGPSTHSAEGRISGLNLLKTQGTELEPDTACVLLESGTRRIEAGNAWIRDLRIVLA